MIFQDAREPELMRVVRPAKMLRPLPNSDRERLLSAMYRDLCVEPRDKAKYGALRANEVLWAPDRPRDGLCAFVGDGELRITFEGRTGAGIRAEQGDFIGVSALVDEPHTATVTSSQQGTEILLVPARSLLKCAQCQPALLKAVLRDMQGLIKELNRSITRTHKRMLTGGKRGLCWTLVGAWFRDAPVGAVLTRANLAKIAGVHANTAGPVLQEMLELGLLQRAHNPSGYTVVNVKELLASEPPPTATAKI